ncbi:MAG TPA: glycosyltransferase family 9 protein [Fimbriimonas sp.]|nr:glycosyltransferase family 9 protein [Fimbriimonas sp.]
MSSDRVLVSMKRFIGDAVMTVPLLDALETKYQNLHIICSAPVAQVLWHPEKERTFLPLDTKRKPWEVFQAAREMRRRRFQVAVVVNHSFRAAITIRLAGIPVRVGHATEGRTMLLTHAVPYDEDQFEAWSELDLAKPLGIDAPRVRPTLPVTGEERRKGESLLEGATVGIQPGARFASKMIPISTLKEVAEGLHKLGHKPALLGAGEEKGSAEELKAALPFPVTDLVGATSIRESLGALSNLRSMVGADTGLMHMASATGCPTVTIFGPTPAQKWGHYYEPHQVLKAPAGDMSKVDAAEVLQALGHALELKACS